MRLLAAIVLTLALALAQGQTPAQPSPPGYSADNLYNLANAYARAGRPGLAVLNYERALMLAPGDPDIHANLANILSVAQLPAEPRSRLARVTETVAPAVAAWLGVLGIVSLGTALIAGRLRPRYRWAWTAVGLAGLSLLALNIGNAALLWPHMHEAVVLVKQTAGRVSPVPMGDTAFTLHEAQIVSVTAEHEDFLLVRTRDGLSGWVARADIGTVIPERPAHPPR